jgi:charged multivesicular body protein 3
MEEMLEDTLQMDDDEEIEEEADAEVEKVLFDLTNGKLGLAGSARTELPVCHPRILDTTAIDSEFCVRHHKINWRTRRRRE